ncbi:hypothetical protein GGI02_001838 [Coemansia sp. RSA 2322]|uniref:HMG box domain-containing protein n=1 Tax=Coemansia thaxteri TaxID=2663907 RepID=A0A9W8EE65_9FUNG|nr:hypothetical protein H4R26_003889 [Coemansia thaxteri]KAJ2472069.1 hypothetical protein GGI02_001838 [Coemansia sp. RSA 2322]
MYGSGQFGGSMGYGGNDQQQQQQMTMMPPAYARSPFANGKAGMHHGGGGQVMVSSRIVSDGECAVFCHDGRTGSASEYTVRQMIGSDGTVFVEHLPGYHIVYVANSESVEQAVHDSGLGQQPRPSSKTKAAAQQGAGAARDRAVKPSNAFIMYRNHKIAEMRQINAEINQTDISREAGRWWKAESEDVKEVFRARYREEKQLYDLKKGKRGRADSLAFNGESESELTDHGASKRSRADNLGLGTGARPVAKPRSRTMPTDMFGSSPVARGTGDLRKQMAARLGSNGFFDSGAAQSPYDSSSPLLMPTLLPPAFMHAGELPPATLGGYGHGDAQGLSPPEYDTMAHSFVSAGIAAGIAAAAASVPATDDLAAAAAAATAGFYAASAPSDAEPAMLAPWGSSVGDLIDHQSEQFHQDHHSYDQQESLADQSNHHHLQPALLSHSSASPPLVAADSSEAAAVAVSAP